MTIDEFKNSLVDAAPPKELSPILQGLWQDAKGDWAAAHAVAQEGEGTRELDRLHAYLHRKEGDAGNARYWYRRAGAAVFEGPLEQEWKELVEASLGKKM